MIKKSILSIVFICMTFFVGVYPVNVSVCEDDDNVKNPDRPRIAMSIPETVLIPVSFTVEDNVLTLFLDNTVGSAGITITDVNGNVISYSIVDTSQQQEVVISLDTFTAGAYILQIEYGDTTLTGEFSL